MRTKYKAEQRTTHTVFEKIELQADTARSIAYDYLSDMLDGGHKIVDGYLIKTEEHAGSHVWWEDDIVRKATTKDTAILEVLSYLTK